MKSKTQTELVKKQSKSTWDFQRENIFTPDESCKFKTNSRDSGLYFMEDELNEIIDIVMKTIENIGLL